MNGKFIKGEYINISLKKGKTHEKLEEKNKQEKEVFYCYFFKNNSYLVDLLARLRQILKAIIKVVKNLIESGRRIKTKRRS